MFIVTLTYLKPVDQVDVQGDAHVVWLNEQYENGLFVAWGRLVPATGGIIFARSGDETKLRAAIATDPFGIHGLARYDIVEVTPKFAIPELSVLTSL